MQRSIPVLVAVALLSVLPVGSIAGQARPPADGGGQADYPIVVSPVSFPCSTIIPPNCTPKVSEPPYVIQRFRFGTASEYVQVRLDEVAPTRVVFLVFRDIGGGVLCSGECAVFSDWAGITVSVDPADLCVPSPSTCGDDLVNMFAQKPFVLPVRGTITVGRV